MITINSLIEQALSSLKAERNIRREDRITQVYSDYPELAQIDDLILEARKNKFVALIDKDDALMERFELSERELLARRNDFINKKGIDPDFDGENYICKKCSDTGYVDIGNGKKQVCECRSEELEICYYTSGMSDYTSFKSSAFDDNYLNNGKRRAQIKKNLLRILVGAGQFGKDNLWIYSDGQQTGKTYLSIIIAKTAIKLGKTAYYIKCEDIADLSKEEIDTLKTVSYLFIDDFAPQVTTAKGVGSELNTILEVRQAAGLKTIIVTSFTKSDLISDCDMRVAGKISNAKLVIE